ncbi:hypothetical protein C5C63_07095 [Rathayibacter sp. AY1B8]|nr:hypothetical protein C5C63_07095 [Rathayibacter sp. AY1B8]
MWTTTSDRLAEVSQFLREGEGRVVRDAYTKYLKEELPVNRDALTALNSLDYAEWDDKTLGGEAPRGVGKGFSQMMVAELSFQMEVHHYRQFQLLAMVRRVQSSPEKLLFKAINRHLDDCMEARSLGSRSVVNVPMSP